MGPFEFFEPATLKEAVTLLNKYGNKAKVLAGGTDLVPLMKDKMLRPEVVISLGRVPKLGYIKVDAKGGIKIGALTTIRAIELSSDLKKKCGILCQAANQMASVSIRNVATLGGNLCNASPSADMAPSLLALGASVKLVSSTGERSVLIEDFFTGAGSTVIKPNEILSEIEIPAPVAGTGGAYLKAVTRGGEELALVGVAVVLTMNDGTCADARIALGAVAPTPVRAPQTEKMLKGKKLDDALIKKAAQNVPDESSPIDDIRGSAEYRREMLKVFTRDAIKQAAQMAKAG